jgi:hypothetical protein
MKPSGIWLFLTITLVWLGACSPVLEATRPTPTDLGQFQTGAARDSVVERLGPPLTSRTEPDGANCDLYQLYTKGYGAGGKIPIAVAEAAADVVTLGLAEVLLTPAEGATRNEKHPVTFCYRDDTARRRRTYAYADGQPELDGRSQTKAQAPNVDNRDVCRRLRAEYDRTSRRYPTGNRAHLYQFGTL